MGETIEGRADVKLGESYRPAAEAHDRIYRAGLASTILLALPFVGGIILGTAAGMAVSAFYPQWGSWPTSILSLAGMVVGLATGLRLYSRRQLTGFLDGLRKIGSPPLFPTQFRFGPDGIETVNSRVSHRIAWAAVLFVAPSRDHWLLQADALTLAVPRRAFTDATAEQAFLELVQASISDEARSRSVFKSH
jgi:hypothetical protein